MPYFQSGPVWNFHIHPAKSLPNPFKKGEIVKARVFSTGRLQGETLAFAKDRVISLPQTTVEGTVKVRIIKTKHNIILGQVV